MGLHSGYPACCVEEFVVEWEKGSVSFIDQKLAKHKKLGARRVRILNYVPCMKCVDEMLAGTREVKMLGHSCMRVQGPECRKLLDELGL